VLSESGRDNPRPTIRAARGGHDHGSGVRLSDLANLCCRSGHTRSPSTIAAKVIPRIFRIMTLPAAQVMHEMPETPPRADHECWSGPHVGEEGLEVAIRVEVHVLDLTAEEDVALLKALDLEGSPPAGGWIRLAGPMGGGRRIKGVWDSETDYERFRDDRLVPALRGLGHALQVIELRPATETTRILDVI
jgi:hypothetical protein